MMWRKGKKLGNVSNLLRFKCLIPWSIKLVYDSGNYQSKFTTCDGNTGAMLLGDDEENYDSYLRINNYSSFCLHRMSTRIQNFKIDRKVETRFVNAGDKSVGWTEDKMTYTDPIIYFYRDKYGRGLPGAFGTQATKNAFIEVSKKKCVRSCKDGWYWTTNWPTKKERKMVDTSVLSNLVNRTTSMGLNYTKDNLLDALGAISKQEDGSFKDQHDCKFTIGRAMQYPSQWFDGATYTDVSDVKRSVTDWVSFDMISYITVRCFRHKF